MASRGHHQTASPAGSWAAVPPLIPVAKGGRQLGRAWRQRLSLGFEVAKGFLQGQGIGRSVRHQVLAELSRKVGDCHDLDDLTVLLTEEAAGALGAASSALVVLGRAGEHFVPTAGGSAGYMPADHPLVEFAGKLDSPLVVASNMGTMPAAVGRYFGRRAIQVCTPLSVGGELIGLWTLGAKRSHAGYARSEIEFVELIGLQASAAVSNACLAKAEREQRRLAQALARAASAVNSSLELDQILDRILDSLATVVQSDALNVTLERDGMLRVARFRGYEGFGLANRVDTFAADLMEMARGREGEDQVLHSNGQLASRGWRLLPNLIAAPIVVSGRAAGYLTAHGSKSTLFGEADTYRLKAFAHHAAAAIRNEQLYQQARLEIRERERAESRYRASLQEKDVLLKEVHHRVKNNLQVVSSLLSLQAAYVEDPIALATFHESQLRINSMALIHERLYQAEDLVGVDLVDYLRNLISYQCSAHGLDAEAVELEVRPEQVYLSVDVAVPCGLILNELITNVLKHAYQPGEVGTIQVGLDVVPDRSATLSVRDQGEGLSADVDPERMDSLGLRLVRALVGQLDGDLAIESGTTGTEFRVSFSLA